MKTTKGLRKEGKQKISVVQRELWQLCKELTRREYGNVCYTCGAQGLTSTNWQTGHLWPKASLGAFLKYDLRVLRPQCFRCNIHLGGNGARFYSKMLVEEGEDYMKQLERDKKVITKALDHYISLIENYQGLLNDGFLETNHGNKFTHPETHRESGTPPRD